MSNRADIPLQESIEPFFYAAEISNNVTFFYSGNRQKRFHYWLASSYTARKQEGLYFKLVLANTVFQGTAEKKIMQPGSIAAPLLRSGK